MDTVNLREGPLSSKARVAVIEELERHSAENPSRLKVLRDGEAIRVAGEIDVDAIVMVVVGSMAGGP